MWVIAGRTPTDWEMIIIDQNSWVSHQHTYLGLGHDDDGDGRPYLRLAILGDVPSLRPVLVKRGVFPPDTIIADSEIVRLLSAVVVTSTGARPVPRCRSCEGQGRYSRVFIECIRSVYHYGGACNNCIVKKVGHTCNVRDGM